MANRKQQKLKYTQEFRETAIKLALTGNKSVAEVARELELPDWKLYNWVQSWKKKNDKGDGKGSVDDELRKLQKRNKELETENEILKKAAA
jgi:transposase-like protein